ncbi:MAG: bifunctional DNA-formamidopyrimidine glycosylase/DNA-(apurinic or apyrimidinic site) lyase [Paracoccaceae bacterium]
MPELPEVETVRRGLAPVMEGAVIARADVRRDGLRRPFPDGLAARLTGRRVLTLGRRSKYLLMHLAPRDGTAGETAIVHLGMSGRMTVSGATLGTFHAELAVPGTHDHVVLDMASGARIALNDARRFGSVDLCATAALRSHPLLAHLGPEPLGNGFHAGVLEAGFAGRRAPVKALLLDQTLVAGLGNIYVCEALWRVGLHPRRAGARIGAARRAALVPAIRDVLTEAIEAGGSSLRDHRQADGDLGYFQHRFAVYDREGAPCVRAGCGGTVRRIVQSGRSTFYCPACQR